MSEAETIFDEQTGHSLQRISRITSFRNEIHFPLVITIVLCFSIIILLLLYESNSFQIQYVEYVESERHLLLFDGFRKGISNIMDKSSRGPDSEIDDSDRKNMIPLAGAEVPLKDNHAALRKAMETRDHGWDIQDWERKNMIPLDDGSLQTELANQKQTKKTLFEAASFQKKLKKIQTLIPSRYVQFVKDAIFPVLSAIAKVIFHFASGNVDPTVYGQALSQLHDIYRPEGISDTLPVEFGMGLKDKLITKVIQEMKDKTKGIMTSCRSREYGLCADRILAMSIYIFGAISILAPPAVPINTAFVIAISGIRATIKLGRFVAHKLLDSPDKRHRMKVDMSQLTDKSLIRDYVGNAAASKEILVGQFTSLGEEINVQLIGERLDIELLGEHGRWQFSICDEKWIIWLTNKGIRIALKSNKEFFIYIEIDNDKNHTRIKWVATLEERNRLLKCPT